MPKDNLNQGGFGCVLETWEIRKIIREICQQIEVKRSYNATSRAINEAEAKAKIESCIRLRLNYHGALVISFPSRARAARNLMAEQNSSLLKTKDGSALHVRIGHRGESVDIF